MLFRLTYNGGAFHCPHCDTPLGIEWDTEYGDPVVGERQAECLECKKEFTFSTSIEYSAVK